jgi:phosphoribosylglycinamide formyltransferase 1
MVRVKTLVILISGRGSNMRSIIAACAAGQLHARVAAVVSNEPEAAGLVYAKQSSVATRVVCHRDFATREEFDAALAQTIDAYAPGVIALAGFMRVLTPAFVNGYLGRLINIHPSLLPAYPGLHTHARALAEKASVHGATVHFVTPEMDGGPAIVQAGVPVLEDDDEQRLAARVLEQEHVIYPQALEWIVQNKVKLNANGKVQYLLGDPVS